MLSNPLTWGYGDLLTGFGTLALLSAFNLSRLGSNELKSILQTITIFGRKDQEEDVLSSYRGLDLIEHWQWDDGRGCHVDQKSASCWYLNEHLGNSWNRNVEIRMKHI